MTDSDILPSEELDSRAAEWRKQALQGDPNAQAMAHQLEAELRRRNGAALPHYDTLDLRTLEHRPEIRSQASWNAMRLFALGIACLLLLISFGAFFFVAPIFR